MSEEFKRIRKTTARKLYTEGKTVYIVPNKVFPDFNAHWVRPFELTYTSEMEKRDEEYPYIAFEHTFDSRVNAFEYYNCNYELGYYSAFYILPEPAPTNKSGD